MSDRVLITALLLPLSFPLSLKAFINKPGLNNRKTHTHGINNNWRTQKHAHVHTRRTATGKHAHSCRQGAGTWKQVVTWSHRRINWITWRKQATPCVPCTRAAEGKKKKIEHKVKRRPAHAQLMNWSPTCCSAIRLPLW